MATKTTVAVTMVKDEADIAPVTVRIMAQQVDHVLVADNGSTDGTRELLQELAHVTVIDDPDPAYYQSAKMSNLAQTAFVAYDAEWIVPFDADEVWQRADQLAQLDGDILVCEAPILNHVATALDDPLEDNPVARLRWRRRQQLPLRKVACRYRDGLVIEPGNHGAKYPGVAHPLAVTNLLAVRHFPYRRLDQFFRKVRNGAAAYAQTDLPDDIGAHWRQYGQMLDRDPNELQKVWERWFYSTDPASDPELVEDPCP